METFFEALLGKGHPFTFDAETSCFVFSFGGGYTLWIEPLSAGQFYLALYQHMILLWPHKIPIRMGYVVPRGPGEEEVARRTVIKEMLLAVIASIEKADEEAKDIHEKH